MKKQIRRILFSIATLMFFITCVTVNLLPVRAATETNRVPITCYTIPTGRVKTYNLSNGRYTYTGYIDGSTDKCVIRQVRSDGYCKVKYPVSRGYRTAYAKSSNFFSDINFSARAMQLGTRKTVYRRSNLSQSLGTVYASDNVIVVGTSGNKTQIIYPISGGYKMGWVSGNYSASSLQDANIADGYYRIESAVDFNFVLDVYGAYMDDGANIQIYRNLGAKNQIFLVRRQSDGYYTITAVHSGKALDVAGNGQSSGTNIMQYQAHGGDNQKWRIVQTSDGRCSFISKCNGLYLDLEDGRAVGGINIRCWTGNGSNAQKFRLQSTTVDGRYYQQPSQQSSGETYYVTTKAGLNLRSSAPSGEVIITMAYGEAVTVYSVSNGWAYLDYKGKKGYASTTYLSTAKPASSSNSGTSASRSITVFSQTDSRWANVSYGRGPGGSSANVSQAGCGVLAYVNAVYYMTGNFIQPSELAAWSVNHGYRINGVGTSLDLYKAYADACGAAYGFKYAGSANNVRSVRSHLQNGGTAVISVPNHIMALAAYDNGKYLILDSYKSSNRGTYQTGYRWLTEAEFTGNLAVANIRLLSKR